MKAITPKLLIEASFAIAALVALVFAVMSAGDPAAFQSLVVAAYAASGIGFLSMLLHLFQPRLMGLVAVLVIAAVAVVTWALVFFG